MSRPVQRDALADTYSFSKAGLLGHVARWQHGIASRHMDHQKLMLIADRKVR